MTASRAMSLLVLVAFAGTAPLMGQRRAGGPRPLVQDRAPVPGQNRPALLRQIDDMFQRQVVREMALSPDQEARFRRVVTTWSQKRGALELEERQLRQARARELTPGVAANPDSLARFVDALASNRVAYAETFRDEMRDLTPILNSVQRGQYQVALDRLLQRVKEIQQQRPGGAGVAPANPEP